MGFFKDLVDGFCSAVSSVCSFISSSASSMLSTVGALAAKIAPYINVIVNVVQIAAKVFELLKPEESLEGRGERVLQAAEQNISLESCDNDFEEYKKKLDEFEIDPNVKHKKEECLAAGSAYIVKGVEESSLYLRNFSQFLALCCAGKDNTVISEFFNSRRIETYLKLAADMRLDIAKINSYFDGSLAISDFDKVDNFLHSAEKQIDANYNEKVFDKTLSDMTDVIRKL